ncbi:MAG: four helix bundle protein [Chryseolinea sp.]
MNSDELCARTKAFSLKVVVLFKSLPKSVEAQVMGKQLLRSAMSVAANYRAACRARSLAEFISKISIVVEEADETILWLEIIDESDTARVESSLLNEAKEILYVMSASRKTSTDRKNHQITK